MGPLRREMAMTMSSHDDGSRGPVLGGETASLLDAAPSAPSARDPFSRAFETGGGGGGGGGYTGIEEHTRGSPQGKLFSVKAVLLLYATGSTAYRVLLYTSNVYRDTFEIGR